MSGGEEQNPDAIGTLPEGTRGSATRRKPGSLRSVAGKYQLGDVIGRGAHTIVYAATHPHLDQAVAVKISMTVDGSTLARMEREARMLARIDHPTVIKVFGIGWTDDGAPFLAMERVHGQSLREVLVQRGPLSRKEAIDVACQALEALAVVHAEGFVHRDIKPANLMLLEADRHGHRALKLIDFGVGLDERSSRITGPADIVGTPAYLAPEQLTPHVPVDRRTDLYALGATLFRMLTGELPFTGRGAQLLQQVMFEEAPPVSRVRGGLGRALDRVIAKALHKSPERRYQTAEEMKVAVVNGPLPLDVT